MPRNQSLSASLLNYQDLLLADFQELKTTNAVKLERSKHALSTEVEQLVVSMFGSTSFQAEKVSQLVADPAKHGSLSRDPTKHMDIFFSWAWGGSCKETRRLFWKLYIQNLTCSAGGHIRKAQSQRMPAASHFTHRSSPSQGNVEKASDTGVRGHIRLRVYGNSTKSSSMTSQPENVSRQVFD